MKDLDLVEIPRCLKDPSPEVEELSIRKTSAFNQWRYFLTDVNPADVGTRGPTVEELASADLWWNGHEFLKKSRQDWPECKFDKPTSTENLELKGTKETGTKDAISYQIIEAGEETASVEKMWRLDPSRYSKGYRVKTKGELEIGLSLVRVTAWVRRFTDKCRKPAEQREKGKHWSFKTLRNLSFGRFSLKCTQQS